MLALYYLLYGTLGIIFLSKTLKEVIDKFIKIEFVSETLSVTLSAQIFLIPIMAYFFNTISILSLFTNIIVVPLSGILTILGVIIFFVSLFSISISIVPAFMANCIIKFIFGVVKLFSEISFLNFLVITPPIWLIVLYYFSLFILIKKKFKTEYLYKLCVCWFFSITLFVAFENFPKNYIECVAIDVGQGDSFLIKTSNNKKILVDGGGSEIGDYDVGENVLVPYLLDRGIKNIDAIIISHAHADHIEGIYTVIENLNVKKVIIGPQQSNNELIIKLYNLCNKQNIKVIDVARGDSFKIDDINFEVLYPLKRTKEENINNLSLVIKAYWANKSILFTGDIESKAEEELLKLEKNNLQSTILKVAHHGANTSSSETFITLVNPSIAVIGVAENNSYGHPSKSVLTKLEEVSEVYMTKDSGEISIKIYDDSKIYIESQIK